MNNKLYRILNEEESYDILYASYINQNVRKKRSHRICPQLLERIESKWPSNRSIDIWRILV